MLETHKKSLQAVFDGIADSGGVIGHSKERVMVGYTEFHMFLKNARILGKDVSDREAKLCFAWSRMSTFDSRSTKGFLRENNLPFEGFVEAIIRIAMCKVTLPDTCCNCPTRASIVVPHISLLLHEPSSTRVSPAILCVRQPRPSQSGTCAKSLSSSWPHN